MKIRKQIGKLYDWPTYKDEANVVTVETYYRKYEENEIDDNGKKSYSCLIITYSHLNPKYRREKHIKEVIIEENQYNDFVDLLRAALDDIANKVENE